MHGHTFPRTDPDEGRDRVSFEPTGCLLTELAVSGEWPEVYVKGSETEGTGPREKDRGVRFELYFNDGDVLELLTLTCAGDLGRIKRFQAELLRLEADVLGPNGGKAK